MFYFCYYLATISVLFELVLIFLMVVNVIDHLQPSVDFRIKPRRCPWPHNRYDGYCSEPRLFIAPDPPPCTIRNRNNTIMIYSIFFFLLFRYRFKTFRRRGMSAIGSSETIEPCDRWATWLFNLNARFPTFSKRLRFLV